MEFDTFEIKPGKTTLPSASIARWAQRTNGKIVDRCYGVSVVRPQSYYPVTNAFGDTDFTEPAEAIAQWCVEHNIDAAVVEKFAVIYFARDEDRTLFLLCWAHQDDTLLFG